MGGEKLDKMLQQWLRGSAGLIVHCSLLALLAQVGECSKETAHAPPIELPDAWPVVVEILSSPDPCLIMAEDGDTLTIEYVGRLENGSQFASSAVSPADDDGTTGRYYAQPFVFELGRGQAIAGVDRGLKGMCFGERRRLHIPSHLAYGEEGTENIPGNSDLTFDYELIKIVPRFQARTDEAPVLCKAAAGPGSNMLIHYSIHYSVFDTAVAAEHHRHNLLEDKRNSSGWKIKLNPGDGTLIPGLEQGFEMMCVNETRTITIPPSLAYGAAGIQDYIPGGATVFVVARLSDLRNPRFSVVIDHKPEHCELENFEGSNLAIHYTSVVTNGRFQLTKDGPEMMETTRLNSKGPWEFFYDRDANIIDGLYQGLKRICVGEKRTLQIPPEMAWGDGIEGYIRPNATIIFEVEAVRIWSYDPDATAEQSEL